MINKPFSRDSRSPVPLNISASLSFRGNKAKDTKPEIILRKALWANNIVGYRLHYKRLPGRPDIVFVSRKIAIFVNGCYWHRCPHCMLPLPKNNVEFWKSKFEKNVERDHRKIAELSNLGWTVVTLWECEINKNLENVVLRIKNILA